jgi:hypothetical protein
MQNWHKTIYPTSGPCQYAIDLTCDVKLPPNAKEVLFRDGQFTNNAKIIINKTIITSK